MNAAAALPFAINELFVVLALIIGVAVDRRAREYNASQLADAQRDRALAEYARKNPANPDGMLGAAATPWELPDHLRGDAVGGQVAWGFDAASVGGAVLIPFYVFVEKVRDFGIYTGLVYGIAALVAAGLTAYVVVYPNPDKWKSTRTRSRFKIFRLSLVSWVLVVANVVFAIAAVVFVPSTAATSDATGTATRPTAAGPG